MSVASSRCFRSCLYALLGSSPRSLSGVHGVRGSAANPGPSETDISPKRQRCSDSSPSPYHRRVVQPTARQTAISRVTVASLWLAALRGVRFPSATLSGELQTRCASGSGACLPSHLHTPLQGSALERSTYMLLGAPEGWLWTTIRAALLSRTASLNTSPTRIMEAFRLPR
jgi:hypothetical protein